MAHYNRAMRIPCDFPLTAILLLGGFIGPCTGQESSSAARVQAKRKEIPYYPRLAQEARMDGEAILRLTVNKSGKVVSVEVVNAGPNKWRTIFASTAIDAAKQSEFLCASCSSDTFQHQQRRRQGDSCRSSSKKDCTSNGGPDCETPLTRISVGALKLE